MTSRANAQIWKIAKWLDENVAKKGYYSDIPFDEVTNAYRNSMYDKALKLLKKINNNEFVGEDNHKD